MSHRSITHVGGGLLALLLSIFFAVTPSAAIQITAGLAGLGTDSPFGSSIVAARLTGYGGFTLNAEAFLGGNGATCLPYTFFGEGRDARCAPGDRVLVAGDWDTRGIPFSTNFAPPPFQQATLHGVTYRVFGCGGSVLESSL